MADKYEIIEYRNATYLGGIEKSLREGNGILITDDSYVLMCNWKQNAIDGPYAYVFDGNFIFGHSQGGKLEQFNVIITPSVKIFAKFHNNLIHQKCIIEDGNGIRLFTFDNGRRVGGGTGIPFSKFKDAIWKELGEDYLNIHEYIQAFLEKPEIKGKTSIRTVRISQHYKYYGSLNQMGECEGLGFIINTQTLQIYSSGHYKAGNLNGIGRTYQGQSIVLDGMFKNGQFKGSGIVYNTIENQYTVGNRPDSKVFYGDPTRKIREVRKEFHLRSLTFINQVVLISTIIRVNIPDITSQSLKLKEIYRPNRASPDKEYSLQKSFQQIYNRSSPIRHIQNPTIEKRLFPKFQLDKQMKSISSMSKKSLLDNNFNRQTKQLVKGLQQQNKKIDLHKIYRQAGLKKAKK